MLDALIGLRHRAQKTHGTSTRLLEEVSDFDGIESPSHMKIHLDVRPWRIAVHIFPTSRRAFSGRNLTAVRDRANPC